MRIPPSVEARILFRIQIIVKNDGKYINIYLPVSSAGDGGWGLANEKHTTPVRSTATDMLSIDALRTFLNRGSVSDGTAAGRCKILFAGV